VLYLFRSRPTHARAFGAGHADFRKNANGVNIEQPSPESAPHGVEFDARRYA